MNFQEILEKLKTKVEVLESKEDLGILNAAVAAKDVRPALEYMKTGLNFSQLNFVTAVDWIANNVIEVIYRLTSYENGDSAVIRAKLDRQKPEVNTVSDIFRTADWHEREAAEMFGIKFINHPDPNRLLLPDGIDAPLRKDFKNEDMISLPKV
jgi:NADH:ubiquinone oxidoreductase subunit C